MDEGREVYCMTPGGGRDAAGEVEAAAVQHAVLAGRHITALTIICKKRALTIKGTRSKDIIIIF